MRTIWLECMMFLVVQMWRMNIDMCMEEAIRF